MSWPLVRRSRITEARRDERRRLVQKLRYHPTALVLLDQAMVKDCMIGDVLVIGDHNMVIGNQAHDLIIGDPVWEVPL